MTNRSTSNSAISTPSEIGFFGSDFHFRFAHQIYTSDFLAALAHLGAELTVDDLGKALRPLVHIGHAELYRPGLARQQLLAERRLVKRDQLLQLLLGKFVGVDFCHALADFLLATGQALGNNHSDFIEILLVVEVVLQQNLLGLL